MQQQQPIIKNTVHHCLDFCAKQVHLLTYKETITQINIIKLKPGLITSHNLQAGNKIGLVSNK